MPIFFLFLLLLNQYLLAVLDVDSLAKIDNPLPQQATHLL
jgi:hypothetical protein